LVTEPKIEIQDVNYAYGTLSALRDVTLNIPAHAVTVVFGPAGGGKTTLLRLILGLLTPNSGCIRVFGKPPKLACKHVGYMPQRTDLDPQFPVSVMDVVLMGRLGTRRAWGRYGRIDRRIATQALEDVGLMDLRHRPLSALSGGQRQRVMLARALACEPGLLLLDEPTANVDVAVQEDLYQLLERLNERMTVIVVTHDVGVVSQIFKTVICVNRNVHVHPTSSLSGDMIRDLYEHDVRIVRHDHDLGGGHAHG
jgi:zinc transport system ATP-binding protein